MVVNLTTYLIASITASHLISDFLLQSESMASSKHKLMPFVTHLFLTSLTILAITGAPSLWFLPVIFFFLHGAIDLLKVKLSKKNRVNSFIAFCIDQILHLISIIIASLIIDYFTNKSLTEISIWIKLFGNSYFSFLLILSSLILITRFGAILIDLAVRPLLAQIETNNSKRGIVNGGRIIGYLERTLILLFILSNNFSAVGFLVAAKSIFRFGELSNPENRKESEYIIIGTMISFLIAICVGLGFNVATGTGG